MIRLKFSPKPEELTEEEQERLTRLFMEDGKDVWKKDYICEGVLAMSGSKCCFSEIKLGREGKYAEIEHFYPKSKYPEKVVEWENLLPISNFCNRKKRSRDVIKEPLVHPVHDDPKEHFFFRNYRFIGRTEKGKRTIVILDLNNVDHLLHPRSELGRELESNLERCLEDAQNLDWTKSEKQIMLVRRVEKIFQKATPQAEYSAAMATAILNHPDFQELKRILEAQGLWDADFQQLEKQMHFCALPERK